MITLGIQSKGPELAGSAIEQALLNAAQTATRVREPNYDDGQEAWINPIYLVPGNVSKPKFEGYDIGYFSKKEKGLAIAIAVPQSVADGEDIPEFIGTSLREAVRLAAAHFASKGISFSTLKAEKIILAIEAELQKLAV
ncbi:MAG: hypothetical protein ACK519_00825 [Sphingomonadaceae bacterium]|jgi:hypothetical protein